MPFTFSHPAIILPLLKGRKKIFSATGLIIGSITPDFESFIRLRAIKRYSHTWPGMFWFDLPLAIVLAYIFHLIIKKPLINNLPVYFKSRFQHLDRCDWPVYFKKNFLLVVISMLLGIFSHLLWDGFTHLNLISPEAGIVSMFSMHKKVVVDLQIVNSVAGAFYIMYFIAKLPSANVAKGNKIGYFWLSVILFTLFFYAIITNKFIAAWSDSPALYTNVTISSFLLGVVITSLTYQLERTDV